ncbi:MAG: hypothetical protein AABZ60_01255 [Planctomycetota bacterium]
MSNALKKNPFFTFFEILVGIFNLIPMILGTVLTLGSALVLLFTYDFFYQNLTLAIQNPKEIDPIFLQKIIQQNEKIIENVDQDKRERVRSLYSYIKLLFNQTIYLLVMGFILLVLCGFSEVGSWIMASFSIENKTLRQLLESMLGKEYQILIKSPPKKNSKYVSFRLSGL